MKLSTKSVEIEHDTNYCIRRMRVDRCSSDMTMATPSSDVTQNAKFGGAPFACGEMHAIVGQNTALQKKAAF